MLSLANLALTLLLCLWHLVALLCDVIVMDVWEWAVRVNCEAGQPDS